MLKVSSGKKVKERVCSKCEVLIDSDDHVLLKPCSEQDYHAGMGKLLDDENDSGVVNRSSSFVKYDGISKQHVHSPKPLNTSKTSFTFTDYLSPKCGVRAGKELSPRSQGRACGGKVEKLIAKYTSDTSHAASIDGDTELDTTASTGFPCKDGSVSNVYFNESSVDEVTEEEVRVRSLQDASGRVSDAKTGDLTISTLAPNKTTEGYTADSSAVFDNGSILAGSTPVLDATSGSGVGASSTASTVLTNASITDSIPCKTDLSAVKSQSYDHFVQGLEGRGTESKPKDTTSSSEGVSAEPEPEPEPVEEDEEEETSMLNDSNKSFSQKLLEVSSTDIDYDATSPSKLNVTADPLNYESYGASPAASTESLGEGVTVTEAKEGEVEVVEPEPTISMRSSVLARYGQESILLGDDSAMTFTNEGSDFEPTLNESKTEKTDSTIDIIHLPSQIKVKTSDVDATLLKGVKGCGGGLGSAREAIEAVETSVSTARNSSETGTVKDAEQCVVVESNMKAHDNVRRAPSTSFYAAVLFAVVSLAIFSNVATLRGRSSIHIVHGSDKQHGEIITISDWNKGHKWSLWARKGSSTAPQIWSNPVDAALHMGGAFEEHMPKNGFRIVHPSHTPTNEALVRLSARLITYSEANVPIDPLVYHAMQVLRTPGRAMSHVQSFFRDPHVLEALIEGF